MAQRKHTELFVRDKFTFAEIYASAPEGFVLRNDRPEVLRAGILGRYPPIKTASELVSTLSKK